MDSVHPSSAKVFEFVERLEAVAVGYTNGMCSMDKGFIEPECGTPGCHGGWAAIALGVDASGYTAGAIALAEHLGFEYGEDSDGWDIEPDEELQGWACNYPEIWGNENGEDMFLYPKAFGELANTFPVSVLINHWRSVGERLRALEEAAK